MFWDWVWLILENWRYITIVPIHGLLPDDTKPSLNQCWLFIKGVLWHSFESDFTRSIHELNRKCVWRLHFYKKSNVKHWYTLGCLDQYMPPNSKYTGVDCPPPTHTHTHTGVSAPTPPPLPHNRGECPLKCRCVPNPLTHWGRVTHICVSKLTIIGSDNGLSPDRRQAII